MKKTSRDEVEAALNWFRSARHELSDSSARFLVTGSIGLKSVVRRLGLSPTINDFDVREIPPLKEAEALDLLQRLAADNDVPLDKPVAAISSSSSEQTGPSSSSSSSPKSRTKRLPNRPRQAHWIGSIASASSAAAATNIATTCSTGSKTSSAKANAAWRAKSSAPSAGLRAPSRVRTSKPSCPSHPARRPSLAANRRARLRARYPKARRLPHPGRRRRAAHRLRLAYPSRLLAPQNLLKPPMPPHSNRFSRSPFTTRRCSRRTCSWRSSPPAGPCSTL